jgi:hypothetical protein
MTQTSAIIAIALAAFLGATGGYWFRGRVLLAQQAATAMAIQPHNFVLAPPTGVVPGYPGTTSVPPAK